MEIDLHLPNLHLLSTAPNTIIEKEIPTYEEPPKQDDITPPSYLERILSMTTDIKEATESENISNDYSNDEYDGDNKRDVDPSIKEIEEVETDIVIDHSELMKTPFKWQISKDFGVFEVCPDR